MAFQNKQSLASVLASFKDGISQPNRYRVELFLPSGVNVSAGTLGVNDEATASRIKRMEQYFNANGEINLKCNTLQIPDRTLLTATNNQFITPLPIPYGVSYEALTMSFYADSEMDTRDFFDIWFSAIINFGSGTINFYNEYVSDVNIFMLDKAGRDTYALTLIEAYPTYISPVDLSYGNNNTPSLISVSFLFKDWRPYFNTSGINRTT